MKLFAVKLTVLVFCCWLTVCATADFSSTSPGVFWARSKWSGDFDDTMTVKLKVSQKCSSRILILKMDSSCWISLPQSLNAGTNKLVFHPGDFSKDNRRLVFARYYKNVHRKPYSTLTFKNIAGVKVEDSAIESCRIVSVKFSRSLRAELKMYEAEVARLKTRLLNLLAFWPEAGAHQGITHLKSKFSNIKEAKAAHEMLLLATKTVRQFEEIADLSVIAGEHDLSRKQFFRKFVAAVSVSSQSQIKSLKAEVDAQLKSLRDKLKLKLGGKIYRGADDKSFGFFGWRADQNGLLINNLAPLFIYRSFQWPDKNGEQFSFNWNFSSTASGIKSSAGALKNQMTDRANPTGIYNFGSFKLRYPVKLNNTNVSWSNFKTNVIANRTNGQKYKFSLLASLAAPGILLATDQQFIAFHKGQKFTESPQKITVMLKDGVRSFRKGEGDLDFNEMTAPWVLCEWPSDSQSTPVLLVFARRPERVIWSNSQIGFQFSSGVGTIGIATPFGILRQEDITSTDKNDYIKRFGLISRMLFSYPMHCGEYFSARDDVRIWNVSNSFFVKNDFGVSPLKYTAVSPILDVAGKIISRDIKINGEVKSTGIKTKWGEFKYVCSDVLSYELGIPQVFTSIYPEHTPRDRERKKLEAVMKTWRRVVDRSGKTPVLPYFAPHKVTQHEFAQLADCRFMFTDKQWTQTMKAWSKGGRSASLPAVLRTRTEPFSGIRYWSTVYYAGDFDNRADKLGDINYWNGLAIYGIWKYCKMSNDYSFARKKWDILKKMFQYMIATESWANIGSPARESGEMMHADMPPAGFTAYFAMYLLAEKIGTPAEKAFYAYLLAKEYVPIMAKFEFMDYVRGNHRELASSGDYICTGFGERYVASFPPVFYDLKQKNQAWGRGNIWWYTGMFGPMGPQSEYYNLIYPAASKAIARFYRKFDQNIPWKQFASQWFDYVFMPHFFNRLYLAKSRSDIEALADSVIPRSNGGVDPLGSQVYMKLSAMTAGVPLELAGWDKVKISKFIYRKHEAVFKLDARTGAFLILKFYKIPVAVIINGKRFPFEIQKSPLLSIASLRDGRYVMNFGGPVKGQLKLLFQP